LWWRGKSKSASSLKPELFHDFRQLFLRSPHEQPESRKAHQSVWRPGNVLRLGVRNLAGFQENKKGDIPMKKVMVCLLALTFAMSLTAFAQQDATLSQDNNLSQVQAADAPLMTLKGTIKADGDKYTFVNDKDGKSWGVINPETLKGHEGHHVELSAHVYADKMQIHVMSVKMMKGGSMGNDSMK
jgi:hypothetical protein